MKLEHSLDPARQTLRVTIPGDLLSTSLVDIRAELMELILPTTDSWSELEMDLTASKMIDSMGLNLMVSVIRIVGGRGGKVSALVRNQVVYRLFLFTRLDKHLRLVLVK